MNCEMWVQISGEQINLVPNHILSLGKEMQNWEV